MFLLYSQILYRKHIVCEMISSLSQLLMKIIIFTLVISRRQFLILHGNDVYKVFMCLIVFLDTETRGLVKIKSLSQILRRKL